jgi:hypothetical protein
LRLYPEGEEDRMRLLALLALLLAASFGVANAGERISSFPRSATSQSVFASGACWRGCQSYCTWGLADCVRDGPQGLCLRTTNGCDRYCQTQCRLGTGPWVTDF